MSGRDELPEEDARFDEMARAAGAALRRPAPTDGVERVRHARRAQVARRVGAGVATAALLVVGVTVAASDHRSTLTPATEPSTTVAVNEPSSTVAVTGVSPPTSSTTTAPGDGGSSDIGAWHAVDASTVATNATMICCESTYMDTLSPPLPEAGTELTDGEYAASLSWPADLAGPIEVTIHRFASCADRGITCLGGPYPADTRARGVDTTSSFAMTVTLDDSLQVLYTTSTGSYLATGADLAAMLEQLAASLAESVTPRVTAGESAYTVVQELAVAGAQRYSNTFGPPVFTPDNAPPIELGHFTQTASLDIAVVTVSVVQRDGKTTLVLHSASGG